MVTEYLPLLMGQAAGATTTIKPAATILHEMVDEAVRIMKRNAAMVQSLSVGTPASKL